MARPAGVSALNDSRLQFVQIWPMFGEITREPKEFGPFCHIIWITNPKTSPKVCEHPEVIQFKVIVRFDFAIKYTWFASLEK